MTDLLLMFQVFYRRCEVFGLIVVLSSASGRENLRVPKIVLESATFH